MSPGEIEQALRRCDRRRRRPWIILLIVMIVILILPVLEDQFRLFSGPSQSRRLKNTALGSAMSLYNALDQFHTEYDCLPMPTSGVPGRDWDTDSSASENIIAILKALDTTANPKTIDFLGDIKDAKHVDGERRNGLHRDATTAALVDPWGQPYHICLDGDRDGFVTDPAHPDQRLAKKAIVWSAGKDGDPETWKDNVGSWSSGF